MALQPLVGPCPLLQFRNLFIQTVGLLGRVIRLSQGRYLHQEQHKHRINAHTDIKALSGIRTHDPSARASEDNSCLRPRGHCDRHRLLILKKNIAGLGAKKVQQVTISEKDVTSKVMVICDAVGNLLLPSVIFRGKRNKPKFCDEMPPGTVV
jgi:hypothetical protein